MSPERSSTTKLSLILSLGLLSVIALECITVAIAEQPPVQRPSDGGSLIPKKEETVLAFSGSESGIKQISREKAIQLAEQHLTLRNNRWGRPVDIRDTEDQFIVVFKTPDIESRLIGQRSVTVDKDSGLVQMLERR